VRAALLQVEVEHLAFQVADSVPKLGEHFVLQLDLFLVLFLEKRNVLLRVLKRLFHVGVETLNLLL